MYSHVCTLGPDRVIRNEWDYFSYHKHLLPLYNTHQQCCWRTLFQYLGRPFVTFTVASTFTDLSLVPFHLHLISSYRICIVESYCVPPPPFTHRAGVRACVGACVLFVASEIRVMPKSFEYMGLSYPARKYYVEHCTASM